MSRFKAYRSALMNTAAKFSYSWEHFQEVWRQRRPPVVVVDLLGRTIEPPAFAEARNLILVDQCAQVLEREAASSGVTPAWARMFLLPRLDDPLAFYLLLDSGLVEESRRFTILHPPEGPCPAVKPPGPV